MINREDMLELTRRMTPARTSFVRMAGCYTDSDGEYDGSFNIHFLKLSGSEKARNLAIAKKIPFAESNEKLREYRFPETSQGPGSIWQMLMALRECGLKNDALCRFTGLMPFTCFMTGMIFRQRLPIKSAWGNPRRCSPI